MKFLNSWTYQHYFLVIGLIFGLRLVFVNPPWQTNDEDRHFYNAYNLSQGHLGPQAENGKRGFILPDNLVNTISKFQGIPFAEKVKLYSNILDEIEDDPMEPEKSKFYAMPNCNLPPFPYLPSVLMMKIGGVIKSSPVWLCWWGRIGSLIAYLLITFYAIRIIPTFKPLLMMVALSPMALYQGASISYDSLSFAFFFLFFALIIAYYFQEEKITTKQILILFLVALLQRFSKDGYFIMFFSFVFIPISKFKNKKLYFASFGLMLIASFLPSQLWSTYIHQMHLPPEEPFQKDYLFDVSKNLHFHLQHPWNAIKLVILNILSQGQLWIHGSLGRFGYSYSLLPFGVILFYTASMAFVVFSEKTTGVLNMRFRLPILLMVLANCLAIIVMFFLSVTPVGGNYLQGLQGRYFTPLLPFLMAFLFYNPTTLLKTDYLKWITVIITTVVLWYTVQFLQDHFYFS